MKIIELNDPISLDQIAKAMKAKEVFKILTSDAKFNPLGFDRHSAEVWIAAAGGGLLLTLGGGTILLAFLDPEPTSKLGLMVIGGTLMTMAGGGIILSILITRSNYTSEMSYDKEKEKYSWTLRPKSS